MYCRPCDHKEVHEVITSLPNKGCHSGAVPNYIFRVCNSILTPVICKLFNDTVKEGIYPDSFRASRVIPLFKIRR